jgi:GABA(A) receptor-associated protein
MMMSFKQSFDFNTRQKESEKIKNKYPNNIPVIAEKGKNSSLSGPQRHKFLVQEDMTLSQFMVVLRKRVKLNSEDALFVYLEGNTLAPTSETMASLSKDYGDKDGFLYIIYCSENTFGSF